MSLGVFNCPKFRSQWYLQLLLQLKSKQKTFKLYKWKQVLTKSNWQQRKHKQNNLNYISLKTWDQSSMRLDNKLTKRAKWCEVQK